MPAGVYGSETSSKSSFKEKITNSTTNVPATTAVQAASPESEESETDLLPRFVKNMLWWTGFMVFWVLIGFGAVFVLGLFLTGLSEAYWIDGLRKDLLDHPDQGRYTVWKAIKLGFASAPSRRRIFAQAKELLAIGVSRSGIMAYLFSF